MEGSTRQTYQKYSVLNIVKSSFSHPHIKLTQCFQVLAQDFRAFHHVLAPFRGGTSPAPGEVQVLDLEPAARFQVGQALGDVPLVVFQGDEDEPAVDQVEGIGWEERGPVVFEVVDVEGVVGWIGGWLRLA